MSILPINVGGVVSAATDALSTERGNCAAAQGFEAIFLRQMLSAAHKTNFAGEDDPFAGRGNETFTTMRDEQFADIASKTGTLGFAKQIEAQIAARFPQASAKKE
jgi:flagellar protein FlgJ